MTTRVLAVRLDSLGDVLVTGPAVRALATAADEVVMLAGPAGGQASEMLPGVGRTWVWDCPWIRPQPGPVNREDVDALVERIACERFPTAVVFTSFHQSPLPLALLLRMAGVGSVAAISVDYPGSLLDVRHRVDEDIPESERALSLARAAGFSLPAGDDGRLRVRMNAQLPSEVAGTPYVVVHPGTSVPARAWSVHRWQQTVESLTDQGWRVVVTGAPHEVGLTAEVSGGRGVDIGGRTDLAELAAVLRRASVVVVGNTGPAHLAAAVGTPVVSLYAPTVPAVRWAPYGVRRIVLGDQNAPCRGSRATICPVPGHPCLETVTASDVVAAVRRLVGTDADAPSKPLEVVR
jgi:ADP-heptose:LPS heptosyltransferase